MTQEIPLQLYKWLNNHQTIQAVRPTFRSNGKCELDVPTSNQFANGWRIAQLVDNLQEQKGLADAQKITAAAKNSSTPASKLYNWNLIAEALDKLGFTLKKQVQREILSGSFESLVEFLLQLMRKMAPPIIVPPPQKTPRKEKLKKPQPKQIELEPKEIDVSKIKIDKPPGSAQSLLEFIILTSTKALDLPPKQIVALLSDNCNYFAHLFVKGMKGSYVELWNLLDKLGEQTKTVANLMKMDFEKNFQFLLQLLKPGLLSKSQSIVLKTQQTLTSIIKVLKATQPQNWIFNYLCKQNTLFETLYLSLRRHPSLAGDVYPLFSEISSGNMSDFYVIYFKKAAPSQTQYLKTMLLLLESITTQSQKELLDSGVIISWFRLCQSFSNTTDLNIRVFSMELMCELCKKYPDTAEDADQDLSKILDILKKFSRSEYQILRVNAINRLFDLLEHNARIKNRYAALIYKKMIFLFLENHEEIYIRQIVLLSFIRVFQQFPTIPVDLIVQPFIKQLQVAEGSTYLLNIFDLSFIKEVVSHPRLSIKFACMLGEFLGKLYTKNIVFSKMLLKSLVILFERFRQEADFQDLIAKLTKDYMTLYITLSLKKGRRGEDIRILNGQKRALIIEMLKICIQLDQTQLNEKIKVLVSQTYNNLTDQRKNTDKGLFSLLSIFGIPEVLAEEVRNKGHNQFRGVEVNLSKVISADTNQGIRRTKTNPKKIQTLDMIPDSDIKLPTVGKAFDEKQMMDQHGIGYKPLKKIEMKHQNKSLDHIKPDPKVINQLEKIKLRYIQQQGKKELLKLEAEKRQNMGRNISKGEILQKNISLGFSKIADTTNPRSLFEFNSIKQTTLPSHLELIKLSEEEDRDFTSSEITIKKMYKIIKVLFMKFSNATQAARRSQGMPSSSEEQASNYISFAQIMRLLKDKNLGKLPSKVIVSEIIKQLNNDIKKDRNVLIGVDEEHFEDFLKQFTAVLDSYDPDTKAVTWPLGVKLEYFIQGIAEGQIQKFEDTQEAQLLEKYNTTGQIPAGYRKVTQKCVALHNTLTEQIRYNVDNFYCDCYEIVDELLRDIFKTGPIQLWTSVEQETKLRKIDLYSLSRPGRNSESASQLRRKKSERKIGKEKQKQKIVTEEDTAKQQRRRQHAMKLKAELEEQRIRKMQEDSEKKQKQKLQQQERKAKLQRDRKAYIQQQKEILKQHHLKKQEQKQEKQREKKDKQGEQKERKKQEKQQFWKKHNSKMKEQIQLKSMKMKQAHALEQKKKKQDQAKRQNLAKKLNVVMNEDKKVHQRQAETTKAIKELLNSPQSRNQLKKYNEQLNLLFKHYSEISEFKIHHTQKLLSMKGYVAFLKDYSISPGLMKQQDCLKLYKYIQRDTESKQGLNFEQFLQLLMRLAVKTDGKLSVKEQNVDEKPGENEFQNNGQIQQPIVVETVNPQVLEKLFKYLKLAEVKGQSKSK